MSKKPIRIGKHWKHWKKGIWGPNEIACAKYQDTGREQYIRELISLNHGWLRRHVGQLPEYLRDEGYQVGRIAIWRAASRWKRDFKISFMTLLSYELLGQRTTLRRKNSHLTGLTANNNDMYSHIAKEQLSLISIDYLLDYRFHGNKPHPFLEHKSFTSNDGPNDVDKNIQKKHLKILIQSISKNCNLTSIELRYLSWFLDGGANSICRGQANMYAIATFAKKEGISKNAVSLIVMNIKGKIRNNPQAMKLLSRYRNHAMQDEVL